MPTIFISGLRLAPWSESEPPTLAFTHLPPIKWLSEILLIPRRSSLGNSSVVLFATSIYAGFRALGRESEVALLTGCGTIVAFRSKWKLHYNGRWMSFFYP